MASVTLGQQYCARLLYLTVCTIAFRWKCCQFLVLFLFVWLSCCHPSGKQCNWISYIPKSIFWLATCSVRFVNWFHSPYQLAMMWGVNMTTDFTPHISWLWCGEYISLLSILPISAGYDVGSTFDYRFHSPYQLAMMWGDIESLMLPWPCHNPNCN